jgi:hypothetical protein
VAWNEEDVKPRFTQQNMRGKEEEEEEENRSIFFLAPRNISHILRS